MDEYINREKVLCDIEEGMKFRGLGRLVGTEMKRYIKRQPAANVVEVVHGKWIISRRFEEILDMEVVKYTCSACKEYRLSATGLSQATNYCPHCGARMDGADG